MPDEKSVLTTHLPCIKHDCPCPFVDKSGRESTWMCYGVRPDAAKLITLRECPRIDVAREAWAKRKKADR